MKKIIMAGILLSTAIFPVHTLAATNAEAKKAIEAYYGEQGFMNRIWACELLSRAINQDRTLEVIASKKNRFAFNDIFNDNYYKEFSLYMDSTSKTPGYWIKSQLTEKIFNTFLRDYISFIEQGEIVNGEIVADPIIKQRHDYVHSSCFRSMHNFATIRSIKRENPSLYAHAKKTYRKFWDEFIAENVTPEIASGVTEKAEKSIRSPRPVARATDKMKTSAHEACLNAKDYEGCVRVQSGADSSSNASQGDLCNEYTCKVTTSGVDIFGLPKPMGWIYRQIDDRIFYNEPIARIPHKGQETRYLGIRRITRYYQNPEAGSSGSFIGGNRASTNCIDLGTSVSCTATGGSPGYISGTSATPGGPRSIRSTDVFDCKDNTFASYKDGRVWIGWKKYTEDTANMFPAVMKHYCNQGDQFIMNKLKVLNLKL